jgi:hypothetical protein
LNKSATNIPNECRIASIGPGDAMILPHDANPERIKFSERTGSRKINIEVTREMIAAGVEALEGHLIEDGLSPLSKKPAVCAVWAAMNKVATRHKGSRRLP